METKVCKCCGIKKDNSQFHKCKACTLGTVNVCKVCKSKGLTVPKDYKTPKFNIKYSKIDDSMFRLNGVTKQDYLQMYEFIKGLGYDVNGDVHRQWLDKKNQDLKRPIKYKKRDYKGYNYYLPNGEKNPEWRPTAYIKKPPTD